MSEYYGYTKEIHEFAERIIERDILANQNSLVSEILSKGNSIVGICFDNIVNLYDSDNEPQEIYEWWLVNNWLADKLKEQGEPVLFADSHCYWGRTCTGQAIILDSTIQEIAKALG